MNLTDEEKDIRIEEQAATIRLLSDLTKAGGWAINYETDGSVASVQWEDSFRRLMGYSDQSDFPDGIESFVRGVYPEDRDDLFSDLNADAYDEEIMSTKGQDFRFYRKDGSVRWYRSMGVLSRDTEGRPVQYRGVTIDISQQKEIDDLYAALQNEAALLDTIHEMLGSGKWTMDFDEAGEMIRVNWSDEFRRMLGYHSTEDFPDVLESWSDLLHPDDKDRVLNEFNETISDYTGRKIYDVEYRLLTNNRGYRWYRAVGKPTRRPDGSPVTYVGVFIDITERKESAENLSAARRMADVDPLTGVKSKNAYNKWESEINSAIETGEQEPFAVVVCDINDLKKVNDLYGHKEGDACIVEACKKICAVFGHSPVFRVGGDEFVVILSGEDYNARNELMERINHIPADLSKIRLGETVSAGMAEYDRDKHRSLLNVAEDADKGMYARKQYLKETMLNKDDRADDEEESDYIPAIHARRHILIVDDVEMNREILGELLVEDYDITYASDGVEALHELQSHKDNIDLVLLDLMMPNMGGREVIARMQIDEDLMSIPVIILTVDKDAELDCLKIGAMDFIAMPYTDIEIVKARISKCIELSEDRELIHYTERDKFTGLLNRDYFFRYVSRLDHLYKEAVMDAVCCDVNKFHSVNKQYGRQFGDEVLRSISASLKKLAREIGGISCREKDDTFLLYCPHQDNYEQLINRFLSDVFSTEEFADKFTIRFGIYTDARQTANIEERFEFAETAADRVKNDPDRNCGFYNELDHKSRDTIKRGCGHF